MQLNKVLSLFFGILIGFSNLIAQCPVSHGHGLNAHLITESCEYECSITKEVASCHEDGCQHGLCNHTSSADEYLASQHERSVIQSIVPIRLAVTFFYPSAPLDLPLPSRNIPAYSHIATTVLRI